MRQLPHPALSTGSNGKFLVIFIIGLALTSCSFVAEDAANTTSVSTIGTMESTTGAVETVETTTTAPTTPTTPTTLPAPVPDGSGCTPGDGLLANGHWFGIAEATRSDSLDFDLACRFSNKNASLAQVEDGEDPEVIDDYYIRNNNPAIRTLLVDPNVPVLWYPNGDPAAETTTVYSDWVNQQHLNRDIWITIEGGQVSKIDEQWAP